MKKNYKRIEQGIACDICNNEIKGNDEALYREDFDLHTDCLSKLLKERFSQKPTIQPDQEPQIVKENVLTKIKRIFYEG
jgi:hypothetical protein|tara:strand:+ start:1159 stop:1395 length:237 start_codon:yes stop_codon:yes gene_type:complete